ncbi:MAG: class I SAM-dependent methyltransferase [Spirochaetota bacterium]
MTQQPWNSHYTRNKSQLLYPDENLVRMLLSSYPEDARSGIRACDIGSGSGRHATLLRSLGFHTVISTDISPNACRMTRRLGISSVECSTLHLPFGDHSFDLAVCWGSLHYCTASDTKLQIMELNRVLTRGGIILGTLRSENDTFFDRIRQTGENTYLVKTRDLKECEVTFFTPDDLTSLFQGFTSLSYGIMERTPLGETGRISHLFYKAVK